MSLNLVLFNFIRQFAGKNRLLDGAGFFLADTLTYLLAAGCVAFVLKAEGMRRKLFIAAEMVLGLVIARGILTTLVQALVLHDRPFVALEFVPPFVPWTTASFPSGHMSALFATAFVMWRFDRRWGGAYFSASLLVGAGRVFVGVHWPVDILVGALVGVAGGWAADRLVGGGRRKLFPSGLTRSSRVA